MIRVLPDHNLGRSALLATCDGPGCDFRHEAEVEDAFWLRGSAVPVPPGTTIGGKGGDGDRFLCPNCADHALCSGGETATGASPRIHRSRPGGAMTLPLVRIDRDWPPHLTLQALGVHTEIPEGEPGRRIGSILLCASDADAAHTLLSSLVGEAISLTVEGQPWNPPHCRGTRWAFDRLRPTRVENFPAEDGLTMLTQVAFKVDA